MERLLKRQPEVTLREWLLERGVTPSNDLVGDVVRYYTYLDLLLIPCGNEQVLQIDEVIACVFSWSQNYTLRQCRLVCKQWSRVIQTPPQKGVTYMQDAARCMNWYHLCNAFTPDNGDDLQKCACIAAEEGYELLLPYGVDQPSYYTLCRHVPKGYSDRHYNLFVKFFDKIGELDEWNMMGGNNITNVFKACVKSEDERMFKYVYDKVGNDFPGDVDESILSAAYYGKVRLLAFILENEGECDYLDLILTNSHCGGHYEEVLEFCTKVPGFKPLSDEDLFKNVIGDRRMSKPSNLQPIIVLLERIGRLCVTVEDLLEFVCTINYTIEEFERLFELIKGHLSDHLEAVCIFLGNKKYETVLFLLKQEGFNFITKELLTGQFYSDWRGVMKWIEDNM